MNWELIEVAVEKRWQKVVFRVERDGQVFIIPTTIQHDAFYTTEEAVPSFLLKLESAAEEVTGKLLEKYHKKGNKNAK